MCTALKCVLHFHPNPTSAVGAVLLRERSVSQQLTPNGVIERAPRRIKALHVVLGVLGPGSKGLSATVVRAYVEVSSDPDIDLAPWLASGCPWASHSALHREPSKSAPKSRTPIHERSTPAPDG